MKTNYYFLILFIICLNLKAEGIGEWRPDGFHLNAGMGPITDLNTAKDAWKKFGKNIDQKEFNEKISYMYSSSVERAPCSSCPEYLVLSQAVNQAIKKMSITDIEESNLATIRSNELEFMYVINRYELENGKIDCRKFFDSNPLRELYEGKKEGSYRELINTVAGMTGVGNVQFLNKELNEVFYYYRGTGARKNIIYEVRAKKDRPYVITLYEYLPTDKEKNPYNLPDLGSTETAKKRVKSADEDNEKTAAQPIDPNFLDMEIRLEKRGKYIPKDLHVLSAGTELNLLDWAKVKGKTKLSVKERSTKWALTPHEGNDEYFRLELRHRGLDEVATKVVLPYRISIDSISGKKLEGALSEEIVRESGSVNSEKSNKTLSLVLTDNDLEFLRLDARKNQNGNSMITLGHNRSLSARESLGVVGGYREEQNTNGGASFVGIQHVKKIKDTTTLVLDLKYDTKTKGAIVWQVHHKF